MTSNISAPAVSTTQSGAPALVTVGRDAESQALSRAVKWHCQHRVLLNNTRTVVFR